MTTLKMGISSCVIWQAKRTRGSVNLNTSTALAMAFAPAMQFLVGVFGPKSEDAWSQDWMAAERKWHAKGVMVMRAIQRRRDDNKNRICVSEGGGGAFQESVNRGFQTMV